MIELDFLSLVWCFVEMMFCEHSVLWRLGPMTYDIPNDQNLISRYLTTTTEANGTHSHVVAVSANPENGTHSA